MPRSYSKMDHLWAPWRHAYIAANKPVPGATCFICQGLEENKDKENLIVERTPLAAVLLNKFPYNNGHLLIAPRDHFGELKELQPPALLEIHGLINRYVEKITTLMAPHGFNIGINLGTAAGAGLPGHLHWHLVPRWNGDTNFMPVLADTKVIVQSLDSLHGLLTKQI